MSDQSARTVDELVTTLRRFVDIMSSHPTIDLKVVPEFNTLLQRLCEKAPKAAQAIAVTIQNFNPQEQIMPEKSTSHPAEHKRKPNDDPSYRPPKSAKCTALSTHVVNGEPSLTRIEESTKEDNSGDHSAAGEGNSLSVGNTMCSSRVSASSKPDTAQPQVLTDSNIEGDLPRSAETDLTMQVDDGYLPSQTEDIYGGKIPASPESNVSEPASIPDPSLADTVDLTPLKAAEIIYKFSRYQDGPPRQVHVRILQSLRGDNPEAVAARWDRWSDGSMWVHMLEMGSSNNKRITIFNMLEYMGACEWYDGQIKLELAQGTLLTTKNEPVDRRGAATHVLNRMQGLRMGSARQGKWISGIGRVTLEEEEGSEKASLNESYDVSIAEQARESQRSRILMQLTRGRKLSTKLVPELGFGVLFCPDIWKYTKMSAKQLDILIRGIQANHSLMKLLRILSPQLGLLVKHGSPDLRSFCEDLEREELISDKQLRELEISFALEGDALPDGELDAAIDDLIKRVSKKLFDSKTTLGDDDTVRVNGSIELPCGIFQRLRREKWLDAWTIIAAMQISDKPAFIRHFESVPLDEPIVLRSGRFKVSQPLAGLAKKISEAKEIFGTVTCLVYFCPINHRNEHFTLLEINECEKVIRHYDSKADSAVVKGDKRTRISDLVKEEFGRLQFSYTEAPTPQQPEEDNWSCGVRVIWNFRRLSNGFPIGTWTTKLCPKRMKLEIVEGLVACVESNTMRRGRCV